MVDEEDGNDDHVDDCRESVVGQIDFDADATAEVAETGSGPSSGSSGFEEKHDKGPLHVLVARSVEYLDMAANEKTGNQNRLQQLRNDIIDLAVAETGPGCIDKCRQLIAGW